MVIINNILEILILMQHLEVLGVFYNVYFAFYNSLWYFVSVL